MLDWIIETDFGYLLGVALIPGVGLLLICRGLWGDRSKGRVRCPKCWYDMRGSLPKLECPECGHDAQQERRLYRTRRGRWRNVIGVLLVLLSAYPLTIVSGWWREQATMRKYAITSRYSDNWPLGPVWLVTRLPDELAAFFDRRDRLIVHDPAILAACQSLRHLRVIRSTSDKVTDADLVHLKRLSKLQRLDLHATQVTDAGLVHLKELSKLEYLDLSGTRVTGADFVHFKGLSNLRGLDLRNTRLTDAGLLHLRGLSNLKTLHLPAARQTGWPYTTFKQFPLDDNRLTDTGIAELRKALPDADITPYYFNAPFNDIREIPFYSEGLEFLPARVIEQPPTSHEPDLQDAGTS